MLWTSTRLEQNEYGHDHVDVQKKIKLKFKLSGKIQPANHKNKKTSKKETK